MCMVDRELIVKNLHNMAGVWQKRLPQAVGGEQTQRRTWEPFEALYIL